MKRTDITPEVARKVRLAGKYDQDPARYDERVPRNGSVIRAKIAANAVGAGELSGSATDDGLRAVTGAHLKTNVLVKRHVPTNLIDSDLLAGSTTDDTLRAVANTHLKSNATTSRVLSGSASDDGLRAVEGTHIKTGVVVTRHVALNAITQNELSQSLTDNALRAVANPHLKNNAADSRVISGSPTDNSVRAVGINHVRDELRNTAQNVAGLRFISGLLGGDATAAASGNHSHSSGNAMNFDRIPDDDQRRILAYRSQVLEDLAQVERMTLIQLRTFVHNLSVVALSALSFTVDAPDIDADERRARKDAGENILPGWEYRASKARREAGIPDEHSPDMDGLLFKNQKHYSGEPPRSIRPPGLRPAPPRPFQ